MKVLTIIPYLGSTYGGTSKVVCELVEYLGNLNITIDLITTNANDLDKLNVELNTWIPKKNYKIRYFSCWHRHDFIISIPMSLWLIKNVVNYDLVHTHTIFAPLITFTHWLCFTRRVPYITTPHGMLEPWALAYKARKKIVYFSLLEKPGLKRANAIHAIASKEAENITQQLSLPAIITIPNGIHHQDFEILPEAKIFYQQFPITQATQTILFLARIDPKKGLDLLAPAFAKVHQQFPKTHLIIAGPDSNGFLPTAADYFRKADCLHAVTFTGMLTGSLKFSALVAADVYVAPSYSEGFSLSILEGMAAGLPCIITTGCNFPEAEAAGVAKVVKARSDCLAEALIECLSHPERAQNMGQAARDFILHNYTWQHSADKLRDVYRSIVNKTL